jgi:hypothetical protein
MEQVFTAVTISIFMMMASALFIMIWEAFDDDTKEKKWKIDLGEKLHQEIVDFIGIDDKDKIKDFIEKAVGVYLKE